MNNDYLTNEDASKYVLCNRIVEYYTRKGIKGVKAWVEKDTLFNGRSIYVVRSNLKFKAP